MSVTTSSSVGAIARAFAAAREQERAALVLYVTAGYPSPGEMLDVLCRLADAGADVIELGVPFSDPLADGPTIQRSSFEAIAQGADLAWTLETVAAFRERRETPIVVFSYLNPLLRYGVERFLRDAEAAGASGVLVTDLPAGADTELERVFLESPLDLIRLIAPTTPLDRIPEIAAGARGFLYYISRTGVTGASATLAQNLAADVAAVRGATELPVAVGFGISTPEQAAEVAHLAEGVIVGSALVEALGRGGAEEGARLVAALRDALTRTSG